MDNYKILKAEVNNFQNIDCKTVEINGKSLAIIGKNGQGKSSFIRAVMSALNSKYVPSEAIKKGELANPNAPMTRAEAIAKLKEAKDLLELDMMSQEEFDALRAELTPIIMNK